MACDSLLLHCFLGWRTKGMRGTVWVREWESFFFIICCRWSRGLLARLTQARGLLLPLVHLLFGPSLRSVPHDYWQWADGTRRMTRGERNPRNRKRLLISYFLRFLWRLLLSSFPSSIRSDRGTEVSEMGWATLPWERREPRWRMRQ